LMALRDEAETALAEFLGKIKGRLTIGGSTIPGGYILPRLIGDFAKDYPGVRVALRVADTAAILAAIADGQVELGLVGATADDGQFQQAPLLGDQLCLVVPKTHRWAARQTVTIQEMLAEPFIVREKGSGTLKVVAHILQNVGYRLEDLNIVAEMGSTEAVRQGIKGGVGISILSAMAIADDVQAGVLMRLALGEVDTTRYFYLTRHRHRTPSPLCRAFMAFLGARCQVPDILTDI
jgi:DNA-binding transcriptional LysR family regulator